MLFESFNVNRVDDVIIGKYYNAMSDKRKSVISSLPTGHDRAVALTGEMLARKLLSTLLDAPEFSFQLLLYPNARSAVANYRAHLDLVAEGDTVACAVSLNRVGVALSPRRPFGFAEAQTLFSDAELRYIYAEAGYSFASLINMPPFAGKTAVERFAAYTAIRSAYNRCLGRVAGHTPVEIRREGGAFLLSDPAVGITRTGETDGLCYAVAEKQ